MTIESRTRYRGFSPTGGFWVMPIFQWVRAGNYRIRCIDSSFSSRYPLIARVKLPGSERVLSALARGERCS